MNGIRLLFSLGLALLPGFLKIPLYRWLFGYKIGRGVRIGLSPFLGVKHCTIGDNTRIGSLNLFYQIKNLQLGDYVSIGTLNLIRGGEFAAIGSYSTILRLNVFNAIVDGDFVNPVEPKLQLGTGVFVATGHWLDFSDGICIGDHSIIGGRLSSFWTHNRQRGRKILIGCHTYLGSEIRVAPGAVIPSFSIVALGSVITGTFENDRVLIGGNPGRVVRTLEEADLFLIANKTRLDIPDTVAYKLLPPDIHALVLAETNPLAKT